MKQRTITVLFMCEQCEKKSRTLKYCVRHGHDERVCTPSLPFFMFS